MTPAIALEITRGCVYACSFCQTPFMFKARFRHRSVGNFMVNLVAGLIAYTHQPTKPSLNIERNQFKLLTNQA